MDLNTQNLRAVNKGFRKLYDTAFGGYKPQWDQVAMLVPSSAGEEVYGWLGATTKFREWIGQRVLQNLVTHDFSIKNKDWEDTVVVDRNAMQDDKLGVYAPMFQQLGYDAASHPDELVFSLLKEGFTTQCYDGQYFFDTDHPVIGEDGTVTSVSNTGRGSGSPWFLLDTSRPVKPLIYQRRKEYEFTSMANPDDPNVFNNKQFIYGADGRGNVGFALWQLAYGSKQTLDETNYQAGRTALMGQKGDNGRPLGVIPNLLVCGPSNEGAAKKLLEAEFAANGATNVYRGTAKLLVCPYL